LVPRNRLLAQFGIGADDDARCPFDLRAPIVYAVGVVGYWRACERRDQGEERFAVPRGLMPIRLSLADPVSASDVTRGCQLAGKETGVLSVEGTDEGAARNTVAADFVTLFVTPYYLIASLLLQTIDFMVSPSGFEPETY
jgi:hypothetical protein